MIRLIRLLLETLLFSGTIGVIAGFAGFFLAGLADGSGAKVKRLLLVSLFLMLIPSSVYGLACQTMARELFGILILQGMMPSLIVNVLYFIPLSFGLQLFLMRHIPVETLDLQQMDLNKPSAYWSNRYQYSKSTGLVVWMLIFILSINDFAIGSIYGYNTYPIEIMTVFASSASLSAAVFVSVPLILLSLGILWLFARAIGKASGDIGLPLVQERIAWTQKALLPRWQKVTGLLIVMAVFYMPFIGLTVTALPGISQGRAQVPMDDLAYTLVLVLAVGGIICLVSFGISYVLYYRRRSCRSGLWLLLIPLMPGTLLGVGVNSLFLFVIPDVSKEWMLPLYYLIRFMPVGLLFAGAYFRQADTELLEAYRIERKSMILAYRDLYMPVSLAPVLLLLLLLTALMSQELAGTLMTLKPGRSTLTVTIYSYLHYGSTGLVNRLSLAYIALVGFVGLSVLGLLKMGRKVKGRRLWALLIVSMFFLSGCGQKPEEEGIFNNFGHGIDVLSMEEHEGVLYAGASQGLYRVLRETWDDRSSVYRLEQVDMPEELLLVKALTSYEGFLLAGTDSGLAVIDIEASGTSHQVQSVVWLDEEWGLPDPRVNGLYLDNGLLWVGTFGGVAAIELDQIPPLQWQVRRIYDGEKGLLVDTVSVMTRVGHAMIFASYNDRYGGITILDHGEFFYLKEELADINTTALLQLEDNRILVGGGILETGGLSLIKIDDEGGRVLEEQEGDRQGAGAKIRSLMLKEDLLFIGSEYHGFAVWMLEDQELRSLEVGSDRIRLYSEKDGLMHNEVKCIHMDGDWVLFGTKSGISAAKLEIFGRGEQ